VREMIERAVIMAGVDAGARGRLSSRLVRQPREGARFAAQRVSVEVAAL
jgi:hypothetical protein